MDVAVAEGFAVPVDADELAVVAVWESVDVSPNTATSAQVPIAAALAARFLAVAAGWGRLRRRPLGGEGLAPGSVVIVVSFFMFTSLGVRTGRVRSAPDVTRAGRSVYVTGSVTLDSQDIGALAAAPATRATALGVITHELAHLVGLDHVDDPTQLMYPTTSVTRTGFGAGDLAGLAALGTGECAPDV